MRQLAHSPSSSGGTYLGNPNGVVITTQEGPVVYHMGDTDIFPGMELVNELYNPTVGIVPIGDRFTMNPRSAALAVRRYFELKAAIPCHYGSVPIIPGTADAFITELEGHPTRVIVPTKGKPTDVG